MQDNAKEIIEKKRYYRQYKNTLRIYESLLRSTPITNVEAARICNICHKGFISENYLKIHYANKHKNIPYPFDNIKEKEVYKKDEEEIIQKQGILILF